MGRTTKFNGIMVKKWAGCDGKHQYETISTVSLAPHNEGVIKEEVCMKCGQKRKKIQVRNKL